MNKIATREEFEKIDLFGLGAPNEAFVKYFIGNSFLKSVTDLKNGGFPMFDVTFEPAGEETSMEWCECVDDVAYSKL